MKFFKPGFFQGAAMAIGFTSLVSIAATNFPGFFIFNSGTPISSSEINSNFEKLTGTILVKGVFTGSITANESNFIVPASCPTCHNYSKKLTLSSVSIGAANLLSATDTDSESASVGSSFNYISIPSDGWYEFRFIANPTVTLSGTTCDSSGCQANINLNIAVSYANNLTSAQSTSQGLSLGWSGVYDNKNDLNSDAAFDTNTNNLYPPPPPEIKKFYLKAGQVLYFTFNASYVASNATIATNVSVTSMDVTIIKL